MTTHAKPRTVSRQPRLPWPGSAPSGFPSGLPPPPPPGRRRPRPCPLPGCLQGPGPGVCVRVGGEPGGHGCCRPASFRRQPQTVHLKRGSPVRRPGWVTRQRRWGWGKAALGCGRVGEAQAPRALSGWYPNAPGGNPIILPPKKRCFPLTRTHTHTHTQTPNHSMSLHNGDFCTSRRETRVLLV